MDLILLGVFTLEVVIKVVAEGAMVSARSFAPETSAKRRRSVLAREKDQCGASRER